jgi:hypothetical protein
MIHIIERLNNKVVKLQGQKKSEGYSNGIFPSYNDGYPCFSDYSTRFWQHAWNNEREMEFYKSGDFWLTTQVFLNTVLAKSVGKIIFDLEYYSYLESISLRFDTLTTDTVYIDVNGERIHEEEIEDKDVVNLNLNYVLMPNDTMTVHLKSDKSGIVQIKYRIIG